METRTGQLGCIAPGTKLTGTGNPNADPNLDLDVKGRSPVASPCTSIPASAQVLVGNATSVLPPGVGDLTIYPGGGSRPTVAPGFLTFYPGNLANAPTVATSNYSLPGRVGFNRHYFIGLSPADGAFKVLTQSTTDLIVDVSGCFAP